MCVLLYGCVILQQQREICKVMRVLEVVYYGYNNNDWVLVLRGLKKFHITPLFRRILKKSCSVLKLVRVFEHLSGGAPHVAPGFFQNVDV